MEPRREHEVRFVLVGPQAPGNIGAAARALKNLGFARLDLVSPRCDPFGEDAFTMAVDAGDVLRSARVHADLDAALEGAGTVVGATAQEGRERRPHFRLDEIAPSIGGWVAAAPAAFVFGRESRGLSDDELDRCTHLVRFVSSESYASFNLAQSVLLVAYTVRLALAGPPAVPALAPPAGHAELEAMYAHLDEALRAIGFLKDDQAIGMMRRMRRMLGRAALSAGDVAVVRGIARQILWCSTTLRRLQPEAEKRREDR